jgi:hypothetical protein
MTLTHSVGLKVVDSQSDFSENAEFDLVAEAALSAGLEGTTPVLGHLTYSATAEGRTGEVPVAGNDLDGGPGLIYSGPAGGAVTVEVVGLDVTTGAIGGPEATDAVTAAVFVNNDIVAVADEGFVAELDSVTAEFNMATYVGNLQPLDVIRVGVFNNTEESVSLDIALGGKALVY